MLASFRTFTRSPAMVVVVVLIALSLVATSFSFALFGSSGPFATALKVGEVSVTRADIQNQISRTLDLYTQIGLQEIKSYEQYQEADITQGVVDSTIRRLMWQQQAGVLNYEVSRADIQSAILEMNEFRNEDGSFNSNRFETRIQNDPTFENSLFIQVRSDKLRDLSRAPDFALPAAWRAPLAKQFGEQRAFDVFRLPDSSVEAPEVSDDILRTYLTDNQEDYRWEELRSVEMVAFEAGDVTDRYEANEEDVLVLYDRRKESLFEPEKRFIELIRLEDTTNADSIFAALQADSDSWLKQSLEATGNIPESLGEVTQDDMAVLLGPVAFGIDEPGFAGPVTVGDGAVLINVKTITAAIQPTIEDIRAELEADVKLTAAQRGLPTLAEDLNYDLGDGLSLSDAAEKQTLPYYQFAQIDSRGRAKDGSRDTFLRANRDVLTEIFNSDKGLEPLVIETDEGLNYALIVTEVFEPTDKTFDEARSDLERDYIREQTNIALEAKAAEIEAQLVGGSLTLADVAADYEAEIETIELGTQTDVSRAGALSALIASAVFDADGIGSVVSTEATSGRPIAKVTEIKAADLAALDEVTEARIGSLAGTFQQQINSAYARSVQDLGQYRIREPIIKEAEDYVTISLGLQDGDLGQLSQTPPGHNSY